MELVKVRLNKICRLPKLLADHLNLLLFGEICWCDIRRLNSDIVVFEVLVRNKQDAQTDEKVP